jgi:hypothetical protein
VSAEPARETSLGAEGGSNSHVVLYPSPVCRRMGRKRHRLDEEGWPGDGDEGARIEGEGR